MTTYFISDLHLQPERTKLTQLFFNFIKGPAQDAKALYVLGDLFNVWMGDDLDSEYNDSILAAFKQLVDKGVKCYFMPGNRDFLIGKLFIQKSGFTILPDFHVIKINKKRILLTHGDILCTDDKPYQRYRILARNAITKKLFLCLPIKKRTEIANKMRQKSIAHQKSVNKQTLDANKQAILKYCKKHACKQIIYGHVHDAKKHKADNVTCYVLGDWHDNGAMIIRADKNIELMEYN